MKSLLPGLRLHCDPSDATSSGKGSVDLLASMSAWDSVVKFSIACMEKI